MVMKRLNYFKYQFLQEKDFKDEQTYHLEMRRKHNKELHTWGRVYGLEIDFNPGEAKITIEPGMAIDSEGREIIIDKNEPLDLTNYAGKAVYLVIAYKEQESDPSTQKEVTGNTRINESFQTDLFSPDNPPFGWDKSLKLILGKITLNPGPPKSDGAVNNIDYSEVTEAGVKVGEMKVPGIVITVEDHGPEEWPGIKGNEVSEPGTGLQGIKIDSKKTTFKGDLDISGDLKVKGTTTTVNTKTLEVTDNIITVNKYKPQQKSIEINGGLEVFRGGSKKNPNAQIIWDEVEDKWKIGLEGRLIDIAYSDKWKKRNWEQLTNALSIDDAGNVGIGITDPKAKMQVNGSIRLQEGEAINEFSTDNKLSDNSDSAVPTEKAVKEYIDNLIDHMEDIFGQRLSKIENEQKVFANRSNRIFQLIVIDFLEVFINRYFEFSNIVVKLCANSDVNRAALSASMDIQIGITTSTLEKIKSIFNNELKY